MEVVRSKACRIFFRGKGNADRPYDLLLSALIVRSACNRSTASTASIHAGRRRVGRPDRLPPPAAVPYRRGQGPRAPKPTAPRIREVTGWIMRDPDSLPDDDRQRLKAILARCPARAAARRHVGAIACMIRELRGDRRCRPRRGAGRFSGPASAPSDFLDPFALDTQRLDRVDAFPDPCLPTGLRLLADRDRLEVRHAGGGASVTLPATALSAAASALAGSGRQARCAVTVFPPPRPGSSSRCQQSAR